MLPRYARCGPLIIIPRDSRIYSSNIVARFAISLEPFAWVALLSSPNRGLITFAGGCVPSENATRAARGISLAVSRAACFTSIRHARR